jgi:hypothetical protein
MTTIPSSSSFKNISEEFHQAQLDLIISKGCSLLFSQHDRKLFCGRIEKSAQTIVDEISAYVRNHPELFPERNLTGLSYQGHGSSDYFWADRFKWIGLTLLALEKASKSQGDLMAHLRFHFAYKKLIGSPVPFAHRTLLYYQVLRRRPFTLPE